MKERNLDEYLKEIGKAEMLSIDEERAVMKYDLKADYKFIAYALCRRPAGILLIL